MAKYAIVWCMEYLDAVSLYADGGLGDYFGSDDWEISEEFDTEEQARKAWEEGGDSTKQHCIWNPWETNANPECPDVGVSFHMLVRYRDEPSDDYEEWDVLEESKGDVTRADIQEMYPEFDFENACK